MTKRTCLQRNDFQSIHSLSSAQFFTTFELIALKKHSKMNVFFFVLVKYTSQLMGYFVQSYNLIAVIGFTKVIYWHIIRLEKPFQ